MLLTNMLLSGMRDSLELEREETLRRILARLHSTLQEKWRDKAPRSNAKTHNRLHLGM